MKKIRLNKNKIKKWLKLIKDNYLLALFFLTANILNDFILRLITVKNIFKVGALLIDAGFLIVLILMSLLFKRKNRVKYFIITSIILTLTCIINSVYYHYYSSFASFSFLSAAVYAKDVGNAIVENVLRPIDLIYLWCPIFIYVVYRYLAKIKYFDSNIKNNKELVKNSLILTVILWGISAISMPIGSWGSLYKLWDRETVVMNFGVYIYQIDDFIQSIPSKIDSSFGYDKALKETKDYYSKRKNSDKENEYSNIFEGKNVIVIHAESIQTFPMYLKFNNMEVTPNLNKLSEEGIFFNNFYSQVGVGTSSDTEFTFNTSLMPSTKGTAFVNYYDRDYISIPKLFKDKGYYTFSMHGNNGSFWNRNNMHKSLGYDKFYSKDSYIIDETIGLGLSDKSFFNQSVKIINNIKESSTGPFYGLLIMLSNHTPFSDSELMPEFKTTIDVELGNQTITRNYLNDTKMGNYLKSVHYADEAIGEFIENLDNNGLLDNTVVLIYGDHDARLDIDEFNLLYNYDPVNDTIREENDNGYVSYNEYNYELDRKTPFIIWSKEQKFNKKVDMPMGMIDVLPTIGNMFNFNNEYRLGNDIFNLVDNNVTFIDGSFLTSKLYYNLQKEEIYSLDDNPISEDYIEENIKYSADLIDISNNIISYDLLKEFKGGK